MSQISLSHQFSNRWLAAPKPVREALVQELDDIVQLLDAETELNSFAFTTPDIYQYIEDVYQDFAKQNAEKAALEASKKAAYEHSQNPVRDDDDTDTKLNAVSEDNSIVKTVDEPVDSESNHLQAQEANEAIKHKTISDQVVTNTTAESTGDNTPDSINVSNSKAMNIREAKIGSTVTIHAIDKGNLSKQPTQESVLTGVTNQQNLDNSSILSTKAADMTDNAVIKEDFLKELEMHIDDYLTERLTDISEDLKAWLREQIRQHNQQASKK